MKNRHSTGRTHELGGWGVPMLAACLILNVGTNAVYAQTVDRASTLRARHAALAERLKSNQFQRPLHLESTQTNDDLKGEIYAIVDHPFAVVRSGLQGAERWCDILMLHLNVKHCRASGNQTARTMAVTVGRKQDQPISDPYLMRFDYRVMAVAPDYLQLQLSADSGPLGTSDYRITVEAVPLDAHRSFLHMSYAYAYGRTARWAMQSYLSTLGRDKVGFSIVGKQPGGEPVYVDGVRGVIERNTMRYYLAIDAYLNALSLPPAEQVEARLNEWYAGTERYHRQLHEMEREEYLSMKRKQLRR